MMAPQEMLAGALAGLALLVLCAYLWFKPPSERRGVKNQAGTHWLMGDLPDTMAHKERLWDRAVDLLQEYGVSYHRRMPFGQHEIIMLPTEANAKHMLKDNFENYIIPDSRRQTLGEVMGKGIFASDGAAWHSARKSASSMFSLSNFRDNMAPVFTEHAAVAVEVLQKAADAGEKVDMQALFFAFTMDSFSKIAFGEEMNGLRAPGFQSEFAHAFDSLQSKALSRFFNPFWKLARIFGHGIEGEIKEHHKVIDRVSYEFIKRRRADLAENKTIKKDLITLFMRQAAKEKRELSDVELRDIIINFMVAGRDTTACALSWFMWEMHLNPHILEKVVAEIDEAMQGEDEPSYKVAQKMRYTEACMFETLRLHPSVPGDSKQAVNDDVLPDGTPVKKGDLIAYGPYQFGRSPALWDNPLEFRPERWLSGGMSTALLHDASKKSTRKTSDAKGGLTTSKLPSQYKYVTFNAGPRVCLGRGLALLESKIALAALLSNFTFTLPEDGPEIRYKISVTLSMEHGIPMIVTPRDKAAKAAAAEEAKQEAAAPAPVRNQVPISV